MVTSKQKRLYCDLYTDVTKSNHNGVEEEHTHNESE